MCVRVTRNIHVGTTRHLCDSKVHVLCACTLSHPVTEPQGEGLWGRWAGREGEPRGQKAWDCSLRACASARAQDVTQTGARVLLHRGRVPTGDRTCTRQQCVGLMGVVPKQK